MVKFAITGWGEMLRKRRRQRKQLGPPKQFQSSHPVGTGSGQQLGGARSNKDKLGLATTLVLALGTFLTPILVVPIMFDPLRRSKELFFEAILVLACAFQIQKLILTAKNSAFDLRTVLKTPFFFPIAMTFLLLLVNSRGGGNDRDSVVLVSLFLLAYLLSFFFLPQRAEKLLIGALMTAGCINSTVVLLQTRQMFIFSSPYESYLGPVTERVHLTGLLGNPNELGFFLACTALLSFHVALRKGDSRWTFFGFLTWSLSLAGLCVTLTLTAIVAFATGILVSLFFLILERWRKHISLRRVLALALLPILVGIVLLRTQPEIEIRRAQMQNAIGEFDLNRLLSDRYYPWLIGLDMAFDKPLLGHGLGAYQRLYFDYKVRFLQRNPDKNMTSLYYTFAHNEYIQLWVEVGLIGLFIFGASVFEFFFRGFRYLFRSSKDPDGLLGIGLFSIGIATLANGLAHFTFHTAGVAILLWVFLTMYARHVSN